MKPWVTGADVVTALRLPLAAAFPLVQRPDWQLAIVGAAAASDFADGILARRFGGSRVGPVIDPVADKAFMGAAFITLASQGLLQWYELIGVLLRDIFTILGFVASWAWGRPVAVPARWWGKTVTVAQLATLVALISGWGVARPFAWGTAVLAAYAAWDYGRAALAAAPPAPAAGAGRGA